MAEQGKNNITELMIAASRGDPAEVRRLIEVGTDVNVADNFGNTALIYAAMGGHADVIELLLRHGADVQMKNKRGYDCLASAKSRGHEQIVGMLHGAKLLLLIRDGEIAPITELLDTGVDVNAQLIGGWTPLMVAALENQAEIVELLLARGAKVNLKNSKGLTAETIADRKGHLRIVELLRSHGADAPRTVQPSQGEANILDLDDVPPDIASGNESDVVN